MNENYRVFRVGLGLQTGAGTLGSLVCFVRSQLTCIQSHTDGGIAGPGDENIQDKASWCVL